MTLTEILTAIIAIYGAVLSTINVLVALRSKRWHVAVTYSLRGGAGKHTISYRAVNFGERTVALGGFSVALVPPRRNLLHRMVRALNVVSRLYGISLGEQRLFSQALVVGSEPPFPTELSPCRSCEIVLDQSRLLELLKGPGGRSTIAIRGVFEDETGRLYRSRRAKVDLQAGEIDFW